MSDDRRIHPREDSQIPARMTDGQTEAKGVLENIGAGGVFFATEDLEVIVEDGAPVTIHFRATRDGTETDVQCAGSVLRSDRYFDGSRVVRAFAVRFDDLLALDEISFPG